jgi:hypothetical protein
MIGANLIKREFPAGYHAEKWLAPVLLIILLLQLLVMKFRYREVSQQQESYYCPPRQKCKVSLKPLPDPWFWVLK